MKRVRVIDIGSNTIKSLVAEGGTTAETSALFQDAKETRLSCGMSADGTLVEAAMNAATAAVSQLLNDGFPVDETLLIATSAVREAPNRAVFLKKIFDACALKVHTLSGEEEAALSARGVCTDPALKSQQNFQLLDMGGGSLEIVKIKAKKISAAASFSLGAVRLTRQFLPDPQTPAPENLPKTIAQETRDRLKDFLEPSQLVGTGGAFTVARAILAPQAGFETAHELQINQIQSLYEKIAPLSVPERCAHFPALPPSRADIMPAALCVIIEAMRLAKQKAILHTLRNLRWGTADQWLKA